MAIEAFPVMIATRGIHPLLGNPSHPIMGPLFPPIMASRATKDHLDTSNPAAFALFLRSRVQSLNPAPASPYEWLEFTVIDDHTIVPVGLVDLSFPVVAVWTKF